jgi:hypothetical protein
MIVLILLNLNKEIIFTESVGFHFEVLKYQVYKI